jgi:uncharacterized membrane protein
MKKNMEKTIQERQAAIEKYYRQLFVLLAVCLVLFIVFAIQTLQF